MLAPLPPDYWSAEAAAHLALRAGFGQTPDESKKWSQQGMEAMLDHLLQTPADNVAPPEWAYPTRDEDLLAGFPVGRFISVDDRKDPRRVAGKLGLAIFQATPEAALLEKFEKVAASSPIPFDDHAILKLATLMMTTPNYQLC
jgi:hypothetical protein